MAAAQSVAEPRTWTVSPFLGTSIGIDDDTGAGNSFGIGLVVGYDLTADIGFEAEIGHLFDVAGDLDALDWSMTNVSGNFVYHFDVRNVTPYATFGLGFERSRIYADADILALTLPSPTEVAFNFGGVNVRSATHCSSAATSAVSNSTIWRPTTGASTAASPLRPAARSTPTPPFDPAARRFVPGCGRWSPNGALEGILKGCSLTRKPRL